MATPAGLAEAHEIARRLIELAERSKADFAAAVGERGLTVTQARALLFLEEPVPMRALAAHLACDASNVTGIADRLAALGLVERVTGTDRRVTILRLTPQGDDSRTSLAEHVVASPSPVDRLSAAERRQLADLLAKMLAED